VSHDVMIILTTKAKFKFLFNGFLR